MPSQQHEQWKHDLFDHLDRKLSGCVSCEFGEGRDSHTPRIVGGTASLPSRSCGRANECTLTATTCSGGPGTW